MYKFFVEDSKIENNLVKIDNEDVNHIRNVLRLEVQDKIQICNKDTKKTYECEINSINKTEVLCNIIKEVNKTTESNVYIHLFQGLPKAEKMEMIIQKTIEVGVSEITPVIMERCVVKLDEKGTKKKIERWQKIAEVAAKQSKRDMVPRINLPINLKNIYENLQSYDIVLVAYEEEQIVTIKQELNQLHNKKDVKIGIIIGPEGGIAEKEIKFLKENGAKIVSLGKRILRTETAPIVMSAIIMYELEVE